jgi:ABC-2 type transport system ATP-binding protein
VIAYDVQNVVKYYPKQKRPANKDVTLQVDEGEIFGILGDNGAGKTTLVRQMVNLLRPTSGRIALFGQDVGSDPLYVSMNVGYMPQETHALNNLTVGEALYFTAHLRGLSRADARRERDELMALWQMERLRDKYSLRLSGGERRLLRLAAAMAGAVPVLILDEPTNDLAPQRRRLVWDVLSQINRERGTTIIFITHDAIEAEKVIQRVGIMREGELVAVGRPSELKGTIDRKLRLEMFLSPGATPRLPAGLIGHQVQPGRWIAWVERSEASAVLNSLDVDQLDDFRLYSATLEDLYVHYTAQPQA